mgnify:CR=1 FL=1
MIKKKNPFISVRIKLFLTISLVILGIITILILVNNFVFGKFYLYSKRQVLKSVYTTVNDYYNNCEEGDLSSELEQIAIKNSELITFNETTLISGQDYHPLDKVIDFLKVIKEKRVGSFFFIPLNIDDIYTIAIPLYLFSLNLKPTKIYFESIFASFAISFIFFICTSCAISISVFILPSYFFVIFSSNLSFSVTFGISVGYLLSKHAAHNPLLFSVPISIDRWSTFKYPKLSKFNFCLISSIV